MTLAQRIAMEHALVRASSVDAAEFMELSMRYRVTGVPKTVVNGETEILGAVPEAEFVRAVLGVDTEPADTPTGS